MTATKVEVREEAINRIKSLIEKCNLNQNVLKYFKEGKVYYSYLTAMGMLGSIDTISYDKSYEEAVKKFQVKNHGCMVYHAIESNTPYGKLLSLLFVSNEKDEWESEKLNGNYIMSYVVNLTNPKLSEFGYIAIDRFGESGVLVRTDV